MSINVGATGSTGATNVYQTTNNQTKTQQAANQDEKKTEESKAAVYEKSESKTYKPDTKTMEKIKSEVLQQTESLRNLVSRLFEKQGLTWNSAFEYLEIDDATRAEAQKLVAEDGYYGVEQTANRLVDFAKAISGGDPSKIELLREAVQKGFKQAEDVWGGKLPDISQKTYDRTMELFDQWKDGTETVAEVE